MSTSESRGTVVKNYWAPLAKSEMRIGGPKANTSHTSGGSCLRKAVIN